MRNIKLLGLAFAVAAGFAAFSAPDPQGSTPSFAESTRQSPVPIDTDARFDDITGTSEGRRRLGAATVTFGRGGFGPEQDLRVYALRADPNLTVVVPFDAALGAVEIDHHWKGAVTVTIESEATSGGSGCVDSEYAGFGRGLGCWRLDPVPGAQFAGKDHYVFRHHSVFEPVPAGAAATGGWVESWQHPASPPLAWADWAPGGDMARGGCEDVTIGGHPGPVDTYIACETWDITKGANPASFRNHWVGVSNATREVGYQTTVSVEPGATPAYGWAMSYSACRPSATWQCPVR